MKGKTKKGKGKSLWLLAAGILLALPLLGWGCNGQPVAGPQQPTVNQDAGFKMPEGWKVYESEQVAIAVPPNWRTTTDGVYRWHQGIEEEFAAQEHFEDISRLADVSIGVVIEDNLENLVLERVWEQVKVDDTLKTPTTINGELALVANCGGINYMECIVAIHNARKVIVSISYMRERNEVRQEVDAILKHIRFMW